MGKIINLGILAHVDAGKTTLTEAILHAAGAVRVAGRVDAGTTITDSMAVERARGITVRAATVSFPYKGAKVNLLDTPGHMDFIAEVERALRVLDAAVLVVSAREGVETQTRRLFAALQSLHIPTFIFINKLDRAGADPDAALAQIRKLLTPSAHPMQRSAGVGTSAPSVCMLPIEAMADALIESDDNLLETFVDGGAITPEMLHAAHARAVASCARCPVLYGAALKETGIVELLDAIVSLAPGADAPDHPLAAEVYQVARLPRLGRVCYARVWSGTLRRGAQILHADQWLRVKQLMRLSDARMESVDAVPPGDIAALVGLDALKIGDMISNEPHRMQSRDTSIAQPLLYSRVSCDAAARGDVLAALRELADEDPLLQVEISPFTGEIIIRIFGEVQMEIIVTLMRERFALDIALGEPRTIYREKPRGTGTGEIAWRETNYAAALTLAIEPCDSSGIEYRSQVDSGYLQQSFQIAVRDGALEALRRGVYGWQVFGARVTLTGAVYDSVTSTPADFRSIAPLAVHRALAAANTVIYEPFVRYALTVPSDCAARAAYDISAMRGEIARTVPMSDRIMYEGEMPLETARSYPRALAAYTKGLGMFEMRPANDRRYPGSPEAMAREGYDPTNIEKYLLQKAGRIT
ncbi:MAG: GTP-binding protein [Christensenellales bacterium]|jgi:ribosomal protection tetracycline resistance protein